MRREAVGMLCCACIVIAGSVSGATNDDYADNSLLIGTVPGTPLYRWCGGAGNWSDATSWWPHGVPGQQSSAVPHAVIIDRGNALASLVHLDVDAAITNFHMDAYDALWIESGRSLTLNSPQPVLNAGTLHVASEGEATRLILTGNNDTLLLGGGRLVLHGPDSFVEGLEGYEGLRNLDHTIEGSGELCNERLRLDNQGEIVANVPFKALRIVAGSGGVHNSGIMRAANGGWLRVIDTHLFNGGGLVLAEQGSFIELDGSIVYGGELATSGNGVIRNMTHPALWRAIVNSGRYMLGPTQLWLQDGIVNDGLIEIVGDLTLSNPWEPTSLVRIIGDETGVARLSGTGTMTMLSCDVQAGGPAEPALLLHDAGHTIRGEGSIGAGDLAFDNSGTIIGDGPSMLRFNPGSGRSVNNSGLLQAVSMAGLGVVSGSFYNDGIVEVLDGSRFVMFPGAIAQNNLGGMLVGGSWVVHGVQVPSTLTLNGANILTNFADVSLIGPGSQFPRFNSINSNHGVFRLLSGHMFQTAASFYNWSILAIDSASRMNVNGSFYHKSSATLDVHITSLQSQSACLLVNGTAAISGSLHIVLDSDSQIASGTVIKIISANARIGTFTNVIAPPGVKVHYTDNSVIATFAAP